jgi:hypothetical protein
MKITRIGWVGKTQKPVIKFGPCNNVDIYNIYDRGSKIDWPDKDWPPRKVRVTVEDVK